MCGIVGAYHFDGRPISPALLERMTSCLAHRGPDDFGHALFHTDGTVSQWKEQRPETAANVGFGTRRLKIIDLSAVSQPLSNTERTLWLTFNGELYNYLELRGELSSLGHRFLTMTDTEVVLAAFTEWGDSCFGRFNGMWGLAIYDTRDGSLILSRDRWGVKPLYVHRTAEHLLFASEIKALLLHPSVPRAPDGYTIFNYAARHYRWVDGGRRTFFEGIENVLPGTFWRVDARGRVTEGRYWSLKPDRIASVSGDADVLEQFRNLFEDAVRVRLRSDVPVASMLSGGLDSSSVTCMAAKLSGAPITTFSARYQERAFDEGEYIEDTIRHISADGRFIWPKPGDLLGTLGTMLQAHDEPICTVTWFAHWLVMKEVAGMGFPVLLNGHVGDELFGGYWGHYPYYFADLERDNDPAFHVEYDQWMGNHNRDPQEYPRFKAQLARIHRGEITKADPFTLYPDVVTPDFRSTYSALPNRPNPFASRGNLTEKLYDELTYETVPATLRPEDRNSMAFSIETRSPFLDYRLVEYAFALPNRFKIRNGLGKWVIREGMRGIIPEKVRMRTDKQGFNAPTREWYRDQNRMTVREILASRSLRERGILDQDAVLRRFDEHVAGGADHYLAIWQWLNLELWMRQTFDAGSLVAAGAQEL